MRSSTLQVAVAVSAGAIVASLIRAAGQVVDAPPAALAVAATAGGGDRVEASEAPSGSAAAERTAVETAVGAPPSRPRASDVRPPIVESRWEVWGFVHQHGQSGFDGRVEVATGRGSGWTEPDGAFRFETLPTVAPLEVRGDTWTTVASSPVGPDRRAEEQRVVVARRAELTVDVSLASTAARLPGVAVRLSPTNLGHDSANLQVRSQQASTDARGTAVLDAPIGVPCLLEVLAADGPAWEHELLVRGHERLAIELGDAAPRAAIDGRCIDMHGEPAAGVHVALGPARAMTDGDGRFTIETPVVGRPAPLVAVDAERGLGARVPGDRLIDLGWPAIEDLTVALAPAERSLTGTVQGADGTALTGWTAVVIDDPDGHWTQARTDGEGRFELSGWSDAARVTLEVRAKLEPLRVRSGPHPPDAAGDGPIRIEVPRDGTAGPMRIDVRDDRGRPLSATATLVDYFAPVGRPPLWSWTSDRDGALVVERLPRDGATLSVAAAGHRSVQVPGSELVSALGTDQPLRVTLAALAPGP